MNCSLQEEGGGRVLKNIFGSRGERELSKVLTRWYFLDGQIQKQVRVADVIDIDELRLRTIEFERDSGSPLRVNDYHIKRQQLGCMRLATVHHREERQRRYDRLKDIAPKITS